MIVFPAAILYLYFICRHSWADQIVPVLHSAQSKLSQRILSHSHTSPNRQDKIEPAAHLDPGPKGHDVYATVGHSLYLTPSALLDKELANHRIELQEKELTPSKLKSQQMLVQCRGLLQRCIAGIVKSPDGSCEYHIDVKTHKKGKVVLPVLMRSQLSFVLTAYDQVIQQLDALQEKDLMIQAMNELGDVFHISGSTR